MRYSPPRIYTDVYIRCGGGRGGQGSLVPTSGGLAPGSPGRRSSSAPAPYLRAGAKPHPRPAAARPARVLPTPALRPPAGSGRCGPQGDAAGSPEEGQQAQVPATSGRLLVTPTPTPPPARERAEYPDLHFHRPPDRDCGCGFQSQIRELTHGFRCPAGTRRCPARSSRGPGGASHAGTRWTSVALSAGVPGVHGRPVP